MLHYVQTRAIESLGHNIERVSAQLTGLTSAVYTQSVSQIVRTRLGHLVRESKTNFVNEIKVSSKTVGSYNRRFESEENCWHCGKIGHFQRNCPHRTVTKRFENNHHGN